MMRINLLVELYDSDFEKRNEEIIQALHANCMNPFISTIFAFASKDLELDYKPHEKLRWVSTEHRMTFAKYFQFANQRPARGVQINVIANSDIYFDQSLQHMHNMKLGDFLCISRWNKGELQGHAAYSQDVWAFLSSDYIPEGMISDADFFLGTQQCDNRIAFLAVKNGFRVLNPCHLIKCHHLHEDEDEITYDKKHKIPNALHLTTVDPCGTMDYDAINVCSHWNCGDGSRMCGEEYIEFCKDI